MDGGCGIVVVGSINIDLVARTGAIPRPGQTVLGHEFAVIPGGKGANQAVAAARLGASCAMVGRVGSDSFGRQSVESLSRHGVDVAHVAVTPDRSTGVALILVEASGQNAICVVPGANGCLTPQDIEAHRDALAAARVCLLQLEIPVATVRRAIELCRELGVLTILDPAPADAGLPRELFAVDVLTPNAGEAATLTGLPFSDDAANLAAVAEALSRFGARRVVLKLGPGGSAVIQEGAITRVPGFRVEVVDTTAAGDAFTGGLGVALARGEDLVEAARYASAAGALACTRFGAQPSMPTADQVRELLGR